MLAKGSAAGGSLKGVLSKGVRSAPRVRCATTIRIAPFALAVAHELNVSPHPFAMIVELAASTAFKMPVSLPTNTLIVAPALL